MSPTSRRRSRTTCWASATADEAQTDAIVGQWAAGRVREMIEASLAPPGRPLRRLEERSIAARGRLGGPCGGAAPRARSPVRGGRCPLVPVHRLRRRQGPGHHAIERPADVFRRRHRLRDREVQSRLRSPDLRLGCRPPRDRRAGPQCRRGDGLSTRRPCRCSCTRGSGWSVAGVEVSMSKRAGEFVTLDELLSEVGVDAARWFFASRAPRLRRSTSTSSVAREAVEDAEPGLLRPIRARAHRLDRAQGSRMPGSRPATSVAGTLGDGPEAALARAIVRLPRSSRTRSAGRGDPGHHGLRDRARDGVPRVLPGRARGRPGRAGAVGVATGPRACGSDHPGEDAGLARDLRARGDVDGRRSGERAAGRGTRRLGARVVVIAGDHDPAGGAALTREHGRAAGRAIAASAAASNSAASSAVSQAVRMTIAHDPYGSVRTDDRSPPQPGGRGRRRGDRDAGLAQPRSRIWCSPRVSWTARTSPRRGPTARPSVMVDLDRRLARCRTSRDA